MEQTSVESIKWIWTEAGGNEWCGMDHGQLDHNILNLKLMLIMYVCVCMCLYKIVDNSEQKIVNNKLLKTTSENV